MITPELISFIKSKREDGITDMAIRSDLINNGWVEKDIEEAFTSLSSFSGVPKPSFYSNEFKKFRSNIKWIVFTVYIILELVWVLFTFIDQFRALFSSYGLFVMVAMIGVTYASAYIVAKGAVPQEKKWKNVVDLLVRILCAAVLIAFLGFGVLFVGCVFAIFTGGFNNL